MIKCLLKWFLVLMVLTPSLMMANLYHHHPTLKGAHDNLMDARKHLERSLKVKGQAEKQQKEAEMDISRAWNYLDTAARRTGATSPKAKQTVEVAWEAIRKKRS
jgi:cation transport regulator ChaB